jgi:hypothetical protein
MYLNVYVPGLQYELEIVRFFRDHRGQPLPSAALMSLTAPTAGRTLEPRALPISPGQRDADLVNQKISPLSGELVATFRRKIREPGCWDRIGALVIFCKPERF